MQNTITGLSANYALSSLPASVKRAAASFSATITIAESQQEVVGQDTLTLAQNIPQQQHSGNVPQQRHPGSPRQQRQLQQRHPGSPRQQRQLQQQHPGR